MDKMDKVSVLNEILFISSSSLPGSPRQVFGLF